MIAAVLSAALVASSFTFAPGTWTVSDDGREIRTVGGKGIVSFVPKTDGAYEQGVEIAFEAKLNLLPGPPADGHVGIDFTNARGETGKLFTRGTGTCLLMHSPGGKSLVDGPWTGSARIGSNEWTRVVVRSSGDHLVATVGGETCTYARHPIVPLEKLSFYAYNRQLAIRDLAVRPLERTDAEGGVMFWGRFAPGTDMVRFVGPDGKPRGRIYWHWDTRLQADVAVSGTPKPVVFKRRLFDEARRVNEDVHCAFTWKKDGTARFFINGIPFSVGLLGQESYDLTVSGHLLSDARAEACAESRGWQNYLQTVTDLKAVSGRAYTNRAVMDAYRRRMPIDLVFSDSVVKADVPARATVTAAPGGTYVKPTPVEGYPLRPATVDVELKVERIVRRDGKIAKYVPVPEATRRHVAAKVDRRLGLDTGEMTLPRGEYRLLATVTAPGEKPYLRTLFFSALPDVSRPDVAPSSEPWKKAALLWERSFADGNGFTCGDGPSKAVTTSAGAYLELGERGGLAGDRKACVVDFPASALGHPCLFEIEWPDDRARLMGFYAFLDSPQQAQHRDRLQGGVAAGGVLPNSGKMQRTEYLFFPSSTNHLFEIRTLANGRPAAIASLKVWRLEEPLPVLKVHAPPGLPRRRIGHMDEDQTFYYLLNDQMNDGMLDTKTRELFRYFAYTGQSVFQFSIFRYTDTLGPAEGQYAFCGYGGQAGELPWLWRQFAANDIVFSGQFFMFTVPHMARLRQTDAAYREKGYCLLDDEGYDVNARLFSGSMGTAAGNFANPGLRRLYFDYLGDLLEQAAENGLREFVLPVSSDRLFGTYLSSHDGYDDWTWNRFREDAKELLPPVAAKLSGLPAKASVPVDYRARAEALADPSIRPLWLRWRADRVTEYQRELVAFVRSKVPDARVFLTLSEAKSAYEEKGIDCRALAKVPGAVPALERTYTGYWWNMFHPGRTADDADYRAMYDPSADVPKAIRASTGSAALFRSAAAYFETFRPSAANDRFKAYFENADVKPHGRHFLREMAYAVGALDALRYCIGNQPIGTLGRERETREFAQAYGALPAIRFKDVKGSDVTRVVCRRRHTKNGTYFYLVNMTAEDRSVRLKSPRPVSATDLSTESVCRETAFVLMPYQLRSFLIAGEDVDFSVEDLVK